jgi:hypothetical protein
MENTRIHILPLMNPDAFGEIQDRNCDENSKRYWKPIKRFYKFSVPKQMNLQTATTCS